MNAADLAALHEAATGTGWSERAFTGFLADPACFLDADGQSFALGRVAADEAELLMLATHPEARRQGLARARLAGFESQARARGATRAFLEVAEGNRAARKLYAAAGYAEAGRRKGYYRGADHTREDALILARDLTGAAPRTPAPQGPR